MRALITGGYGFVGKHLANHLVSCGDDVAVTYLPGVEVPQDRDSEEKGIRLPAVVQSFALDVAQKDAVEQLIALTKPDVVYHLAAISFVPQGENDSSKIYQANLMGTVHCLDAIAKKSPSTRFLLVSSAEVYGDPLGGSLPLNEQMPLRPISTYGVTKAAAELAAYKAAIREGVYTVRVRPFPHIGPGQSDSFAISSFAKQVAEIALGKKEPKVLVGNLEVKRDYSDVSDIVRGYREAALNGKRGDVYNLCSGKSLTIGSMLQELIKISGKEIEVQPDPARMRAIDIPDSYGSYDKAHKDFGWKPRIDLLGTMHSNLAYWVEMLS
ncbi:MAG: GDP-mannose 4,6-dehydratase [Deltaproteobacteria bacterium]|nr:GDP-mannose 4,6-dehydratase [Deltaproteobacteria bacterium]